MCVFKYMANRPFRFHQLQEGYCPLFFIIKNHKNKWDIVFFEKLLYLCRRIAYFRYTAYDVTHYLYYKYEK